MERTPPTSTASPPRLRERASSTVEYVGLGALSTLLASGIAAAVDSTVGDRLTTAIVHRLLAAIAGSG